MVHPLTAQMQALIRADGYNIHTAPGKQRMHWFRQAWVYGAQMDKKSARVLPLNILEIGQIIEPAKNRQFRAVTRKGKPNPESIQDLLFGLCRTVPLGPHDQTADSMPVWQWIGLFKAFDPFVEGTDRVALVLEAWHHHQFNPTAFMEIRTQ